MKAEKILDVLGNVDEKYIGEADPETIVKRKPAWTKWAAMAACLCLLAAGAAAVFRHSANPSGITAGGDPSATMEGGDYSTGSYSVAVYPADENLEDVASADVVSLTEDEAMKHLLAAYLPTQHPEGFHYGRGAVYQTEMKDGTQYQMLRIEYINGTIPEQQYSDDGGAIAPEQDTTGALYTICVYNFEPNTDTGITPIEAVTETMLEENFTVYIRAGECYISVSLETANPATVLEAIKYIK